MSTAEQVDELTDLSSEDAQELRAFLEKRRWFEGKLEFLESIPPIYPFVHPELEESATSSDEKYARVGSTSSAWQLPDEDQIQSWRHERDIIEGEVLEFDGGDLERIKEKTRLVTLQPLTPPSTHLVSITLDLVVLIDRILSLLRRRDLILDLTTFRLQWDRARWQVMSEARGLGEEVDTMVRDKGRWTPGDVSQTSSQGMSKSADRGLTSSNTSLGTTEAMKTNEFHLEESGSSSSGKGSNTITKSPSAASLIYTPDRSLHIPLLHSQLVNLRIRHKNLESTQLVRSGALLDRMIYVASHLRDIGDTNGPSKVSTQSVGGAVPDQLLDLQDELDASVTELGERVAWCGELEEHWKSSEIHYLSSLQAHKLAQTALDDLVIALSLPATSDQHRHISNLYEMAQRRLPAVIANVSCPSHPAYPENDQYNDRVVEALAEARDSASETIKRAREWLDWYTSLVKSRDIILDRHAEIKDKNFVLRSALQSLQGGDAGHPRPEMDNHSCLGDDFEPWLNSVPDWSQEVLQVSKEAGTMPQLSTLAILQYRNHLKMPPRSLRTCLPTNMCQDAAVDEAERDVDRLLDLMQSAPRISSVAEQDAQIIRTARSTIEAAASVKEVGLSLKPQLERLIQQSAYPSSQSDGSFYLIMEDQVKALDQKIKVEIAAPLASLNDYLRSHDRRLPKLRQHLALDASTLIELQCRFKEQLDLATRVHKQNQAIRVIEDEAGKKIRAVDVERQEAIRIRNEGLQDESFQPIIARVESLEKNTVVWESHLASRVPFVASFSAANEVPTSRNRSKLPEVLSEVHITPFTPLPTTQPLPTDSLLRSLPQDTLPELLDLLSLDHTVRASVNDHTLQVRTAIANCKSLCQSFMLDTWMNSCHRQKLQFDEALGSWLSTRDKCRIQIEGLSDEIDTPPSSINAAEATVQAVEAMQAAIAPRLDEHSAEIKRSISKVGDVVQGRPAWADGPFTQRSHEWTVALNTARDVVLETAEEIRGIAAAGEELSWRARERLNNAQRDPRGAPILPTDKSTDILGPQTPGCLDSDSSAPLHTPSDDLLSRIKQAQKDLDDLNVHLVVNPKKAELETTPMLKKLPTLETASSLAERLESIQNRCKSFAIDRDDSAYLDFRKLEQSLASCRALIPRLEQLVAFRDSVKTCDAAQIRLMDTIDDSQAEHEAHVLRSRAEGEEVLKKVIAASLPVATDSRVSSELERLTTTSRDLEMLVEECLHPKKKRLDLDDTATEMTRAASVMSLSSTTFPVSPAHHGSRLPRLSNSTARPSSETTPHQPQVGLRRYYSALGPTEAARNRSVSDTPSRILRKGFSIADTSRPRGSLGSAGLSTTHELSKSDSHSNLTSVPRRSRVSNSSISVSAANATPPAGSRPASRLRRTSHLPRVPLASKEYVPNPKRKLDVAVGKIVNKLDVSIPVRPVNPALDEEGEEWHDQSGQYWIGSEGRSKLCFCRILRSKTVMVRVGGGWVELSRFLLDHFSQVMGSGSAPGLRKSLSSSSSFFNLDRPIPLTSASLAAQSSRTSLPISYSNNSILSLLSDPNVDTDSAPVHPPVPPVPQTPNNHMMRQNLHKSINKDKLSPSSPGSPQKHHSVSPSSSMGAGSPLVALQFIRKAGESPSAREKEREKERSGYRGRTSVFGRDG